MKFLSSERLSKHKYKTPEGYLICTDAILARTGKQSYQRNEIFADAADDNTIIEIDRPSEEVFAPETLASFENKPVTVEHPDENVGPDNYNNLAVGFVRDVHKGIVNGQEVMLGTLVITDAKTIEEIENGEHTDLSCGYDCDIIDEANPKQRNIRGNHVALCQQGRAGIARIVDSVKDSDYTINFKNDYAGFREKTFIKANSVKNALKEFAKEVSLRGWGTRNVDIISISPNDGNMRLYGNLYDLLKTIDDSIKDSSYYVDVSNATDREIANFITLAQNKGFSTVDKGHTIILTNGNDDILKQLKNQIFTTNIKFIDSKNTVKDKAIPSSLINELNRKIEEFKRRGYDEEDLQIKVEDNKIWFTGELSYNTHWKLAEELDKILQKYNKDAYFDAETSGRWFAVYDSKIDMNDSFYGGVDEATLRQSNDFVLRNLFKELDTLMSKHTSLQEENRIYEIKQELNKRAKQIKYQFNDVFIQSNAYSVQRQNDEDNNNENEDEFIQAHSDAKAMYEEIISREAMTEEEAKRLVYKYFKGKDSITDVVSKIERYKNVDIYKDEANNLLADFSKTSTGKRLRRLNTKNINKAKEIIDDMIDFITDSLIQLSSKDEQKPYAITPRSKWQSNKKLEQFFTSLEEAKYVKNASEKADGIDYVVVDTRTMRIVDGKKTFTIKTEDKDNIYIAKIRANNAIEAFNKFNNKK